MGFWKKTAVGAVIGITFGITAALGFIGVKSAVSYFMPDRSISAQKDENPAGANDESTSDKAQNNEEDKKVENATLTKTLFNGDEETRDAGMSVTELAKNNLPCVVSITNTSVQVLRDMWGRQFNQSYESVSRGSGIIIGQTDEELLIATNSHVVKGADSITVGFVDSQIYDAVVKGADDEIDLAVVGVKMSDIKKDTLDEIKVAVMGDSDKLEVGEQVVAIGNAIGYGQSVTTGIVSALGRDIPDDDVETQYIQTDAAINPGNSGGALLNMRGEVIGINSAKIASTYVEGIGYAIPVNVASPTIESLMNRKSRDKVDEDKAGYLGITGVSVDAQTSKMYGIPEGIYLQEVIKGGPADDAGLLKGDIVKKFDGVSVSSIADLREKMDYYEAGEKVDVTFCRQENGEYTDKTVSVTLTTKSEVGFEDENGDADTDEEDKDADNDKDKKDKKDNDKDDKKEDHEYKNDDPSKDYFNSLPDELKEFFFGFGR